jgi:hypothetical protein
MMGYNQKYNKGRTMKQYCECCIFVPGILNLWTRACACSRNRGSDLGYAFFPNTMLSGCGNREGAKTSRACLAVVQLLFP